MQYLTSEGIMSKIYFESVHTTEFYKKLGYSHTYLPVTDKTSKQILSLPIFPTMKSSELKLIVDVISRFMNKNCQC